MKTKTNSDTEEGQAVALIDAIDSICLVLSSLLHEHTPAIKEAIKNLQHTIDEWELDLVFRRPPTKEEIENRRIFEMAVKSIKAGSIKIKK